MASVDSPWGRRSSGFLMSILDLSTSDSLDMVREMKGPLEKVICSYNVGCRVGQGKDFSL